MKKGFTLIELLVVIAIIGILSGIVLTSLGSARDKARNASATASLSSMRAEAEISVSNAGVYPVGICSVTTANGTFGAPLDTLATAVASQGIDDLACSVDSETAPTAWAAGSPTLGFCVDSSGFAGPGTLAASGVCTPAS